MSRRKPESKRNILIISALIVLVVFAPILYVLTQISFGMFIFMGIPILVITPFILAMKFGLLAPTRAYRKPPIHTKQVVTFAPDASARCDVVDMALSRAQRHADDSPLRLIDIGLLVYEGKDGPKVFRSSNIPTNATYIRPFIVLNVPDATYSDTDETISFSILDSSGELLLDSHSQYLIRPEKNFVTSKTWLALTGQRTDGIWSLRVDVNNNVPFAVHEFDWLKIGGEVRTEFTGDGEIDELMLPAIDQNAEETMSIDELLGDQGEQAPLVMNARR